MWMLWSNYSGEFFTRIVQAARCWRLHRWWRKYHLWAGSVGFHTLLTFQSPQKIIRVHTLPSRAAWHGCTMLHSYNQWPSCQVAAENDGAESVVLVLVACRRWGENATSKVFFDAIQRTLAFCLQVGWDNHLNIWGIWIPPAKSGEQGCFSLSNMLEWNSTIVLWVHHWSRLI